MAFYLSVLINSPIPVDSVQFFSPTIPRRHLEKEGKLGLICLLPTYREELPDLNDLKSNSLPLISFIKKNCTWPGLSLWDVDTYGSFELFLCA